VVRGSLPAVALADRHSWDGAAAAHLSLYAALE
jgi:hypothetical protein